MLGFRMRGEWNYSVEVDEGGKQFINTWSMID